MPTFGTVCDGIGCGHLAFNRAGFDCAWSFEIEAFPSAVLAYRFPDVKNHGDMLKCVGMIESGEIEAPDVFIGGTPCQAFSVAGKRKGLEDARGNLSLAFCGIADAIDDVRGRDGKPPCAVLWENVPGVLSDKGNAFGCFLGELSGAGCQLQPAGGRWRNAGCVFGPKRTVAWRVLDSQFFGVAQRRRRVFVVASAGDGFRPEEILFEREGVRRDSPPCREKGEGVAHDLAPSLTSSGRGVERARETRGQDPVVAVCPTLRAGGNATGGHRPPGTDVDTCDSLIPVHTTGDGAPCVATRGVAFGGEIARTLSARHDSSPCADRGMDVVAQGMQVRRLTPRECERLQALPDDWAKIPWRGKPIEECPDGPRYKAIGNGQTVTVMEWLARRIMAEMTR